METLHRLSSRKKEIVDTLLPKLQDEQEKLASRIQGIEKERSALTGEFKSICEALENPAFKAAQNQLETLRKLMSKA
jgi:hypothetical protein